MPTSLAADDLKIEVTDTPLPAGWRSSGPHSLAQMVCEAPVPEVDGPAITPLTDAHRDDVLALTALVYPHYFRPRTMDLGRYFGIYDRGRLAAMIGMGPDNPDFVIERDGRVIGWP